MSLESINIGCHVFNARETIPVERTILVLGLPRGGTSFITCTLANLGIPFDQPAPNYDNGELFTAVTERDWLTVQAQIESMDNRYPVWGTKLMGPAPNVAEAISYVRSPMLICVFRDPCAVAIRKRMVGKGPYDEVERGIFATLSGYRKLIAAIKDLPPLPTMLVSYGNAMQNIAVFVQTVNEFIGKPFLSLTPELCREIGAEVLCQGGTYRRAKKRKEVREQERLNQKKAEKRRLERKERRRLEKRARVRLERKLARPLERNERGRLDRSGIERE
jgi:hypothetical protein